MLKAVRKIDNRRHHEHRAGGDGTGKPHAPGQPRIVSLPSTEGTIRGYAAASLIVIDEAARVADELLAQCTPNACGIEWKAGRPLDSSAVTVPTPCVKIPRPAPMSAAGQS